MEVFRLEVHLITNLEVWGQTPFCICWSLVAFLGFQHLQLEEGMEFVQICDVGLGRGRGEITIRVDGEVGVIALVGEEQGYTNGSARHIVE